MTQDSFVFELDKDLRLLLPDPERPSGVSDPLSCGSEGELEIVMLREQWMLTWDRSHREGSGDDYIAMRGGLTCGSIQPARFEADEAGFYAFVENNGRLELKKPQAITQKPALAAELEPFGVLPQRVFLVSAFPANFDGRTTHGKNAAQLPGMFNDKRIMADGKLGRMFSKLFVREDVEPKRLRAWLSMWFFGAELSDEAIEALCGDKASALEWARENLSFLLEEAADRSDLENALYPSWSVVSNTPGKRGSTCRLFSRDDGEAQEGFFPNNLVDWLVARYGIVELVGNAAPTEYTELCTALEGSVEDAVTFVTRHWWVLRINPTPYDREERFVFCEKQDGDRAPSLERFSVGTLTMATGDTEMSSFPAAPAAINRLAEKHESLATALGAQVPDEQSFHRVKTHTRVHAFMRNGPSLTCVTAQGRGRKAKTETIHSGVAEFQVHDIIRNGEVLGELKVRTPRTDHSFILAALDEVNGTAYALMPSDERLPRCRNVFANKNVDVVVVLVYNHEKFKLQVIAVPVRKEEQRYPRYTHEIVIVPTDSPTRFLLLGRTGSYRSDEPEE